MAIHLLAHPFIIGYLNRYYFLYLPTSVDKHLSHELSTYLRTDILSLVQTNGDKQAPLSMWHCLAFKGSVCPGTALQSFLKEGFTL